MTDSNLDKMQEAISVTDNTGLITFSVPKKVYKGVILTENELQMYNTSNTILDIIAEVFVILASTLLGYLLNLIPVINKLSELSLENAIFICLTIIFFGIAITIKVIRYYLQKRIFAKNTI